MKIKLKNTIMFQISILNVLMLVAFIVVMALVVGSMKNTNTNSSSMFEYVIELTTDEAELKSDVMSLYDQATGYISADAQETKDALSPQIDKVKEEISADIKNIEHRFKDSNNKEAREQIKEIAKQYELLNELVDKSIKASDSGNNDVAYKILFNQAEIQKIAIFHSTKVLDSAVEQSTKETTASMDTQLKKGVITALVGILVCIVIIILNFLICYFKVISKIKSMAKEVGNIIAGIEKGEGDLTARVDTKTTSELAYIKSDINLFIETLQKIMKAVKDGTVILTHSTKKVKDQVNNANENITNTSAALEQLSASMETVSGTVERINENVDSVKSAADDISNEANEGNSEAEIIKKEADELRRDIIKKKTETTNNMDELSVVLEKSLKDSEKVSQINELTDVILDIADETNLLSLNASIEAARAGEVGKGFAVVASEISSLAENSRETASRIQKISEEVTEAVSELAINAKNVLEFINTTVLADYDTFVDTGEKYENTANVMTNMLGKFSNKAENLDIIMAEMLDSVNMITTTVQESSEAINMSAENSTEIVAGVQEISEAMEENMQVTAKLGEETKKFVTL